jgi:hypothetical protein
MLRNKRFTILTGGNIKMSKKKSYMSLLKEAIAEFDTSDNLEVKGPMLDPILSWDGGGEIPVYKDAASILERYYFNEDRDDGVDTLDEAELDAAKQNDKGSAGGPSMKHGEGTGTEQAGTSDSDTVLGGKEDKAKDIAKEDIQLEQEKEEKEEEEEEAVEEKEFAGKDVPEKKEYTEESEELEMENAIIEKLISEMEDEDEDKDEKEEVEEAEVMNYTGEGPKTEAPKEKKASGPEEDTQGAGTEQAGTGVDAGEVPPRKDVADKMVKAKNYTDENTMIEAALAELEAEITEQDEPPSAPDDEEEEELDVDKEMAASEQAPPPSPSAVPGGPGPKDKGEDKDDEVYEEAFQLFKEAIKEQDEEEEKEEKEEEKEEE